MNVLILNSVTLAAAREPSIQELRFQARVDGETPRNDLDLVLVDAIGMDKDTVKRALDQVVRIRESRKVEKVAMVWPKPPIELVVEAMRAGVNDIFEEPITTWRMLRLVFCGRHKLEVRKAARAIAVCARVLEAASAMNESPEARDIRSRERKLAEREELLAAESRRLEDLREVLQIREADLRSSASRLDEEFARMQMDLDVISNGGAAVQEVTSKSIEVELRERKLLEREAEMEARIEEMNQRERLLEERDTALQSLEAALMKQVIHS